MRILITNDDGIHGPGLEILEKIAKNITDDIWVVACEEDQSGSSHSLTLRNPIRIRKITDKKFAITGTPTDCVLIACNHLLKGHKPDLILSGVNYGGNLAEDITYSGTIAAAMEGSLLGIKSIAFSMYVKHLQPAKWETALHYGPMLIEQIKDLALPPLVFLNINFPDLEIPQIKGVKLTAQSHRQGADNLVECHDPRGKPYYWIGAALYRYNDDFEFLEEGSDLEAISKGFISVTPITLNLTHLPSLKNLKTIFNG